MGVQGALKLRRIAMMALAIALAGGDVASLPIA